MTLKLDQIPPSVLDDLREAEFSDTKIARMSPREALDEYLQYNGIIGFTGMIINALDGLRAAAIEKDV
jgi:hypothetical protein